MTETSQRRVGIRNSFPLSTIPFTSITNNLRSHTFNDINKCSSHLNSTASSTSSSSCPARAVWASHPSRLSSPCPSLLVTRPSVYSISIYADPVSHACWALTARVSISHQQGMGSELALQDKLSRDRVFRATTGELRRMTKPFLLSFMDRWVPVFADEKKQLCCMSIGFMLENKDDSVVWRGPKKTGMAEEPRHPEIRNSLD